MTSQDICENNFIIDFINDDTIEIGIEDGCTIEIDLANGEYQVQSDYNQTDIASTDYIKNKPTKLSDFTNDLDIVLSSELNTTNSNLSFHTSDTSNPHSVTKSQVGLSNVDNTSDINKPISAATQTALNLKQDIIVQTLTDASSISWNMQNGNVGVVTLAHIDRTLANPTNIVAGGRYTLIVKQDATGSRTITTWGAYFKFPATIKPTLTATANAVDIIEFVAESSSVLYCTNFIPDVR